MPYRRSRPLVPSRRIAYLLAREGASAEIAERLWEVLGLHTPAVERDESLPAAFYLDASGVGQSYGSEADWCLALLAETPAASLDQVKLGLAGSKFAAWVAAQTIPTGQAQRIIQEPDARFLAPLTVDWLPLAKEPLRRLHLLGLQTLGQFAALPSTAVAEQFGPEILPAWRWARGQDQRPVRGQRCQLVTASHLFDAPDMRSENLLAIAAYLAERALQDLPVDRHTWAIRQVKITALTESGVQLDAETWLGSTPGQETMTHALARLIARLDGADTGIVELGVALWGLEPAPGRQLSLMEAQETAQRWRQVLEIMNRRYAAQLLRPELADPDAPILTERYALQSWLA
ncbi:MAG: hypothetical protein GX601_19295 [Anaerolineales bacterium]|nr:hypothetical protein [Anaerolineales bacterium]